jgi:hypothetical protein
MFMFNLHGVEQKAVETATARAGSATVGHFSSV